MAKTGDTDLTSIAPDRRQLTELQAFRLGALSGIEPKELAGVVHADLSEKFKWRIDPELLFMRRVCGQVVKRDASTGVDYPVPFATVQVEDTDCSFVGFFPDGWAWGWYFPFRCHREVIATVTTDECGRFCVWIPRFDIDWILRWRAERVCFPDIFIRPSLEDILDDIVDGPWPPIKLPDKGDPPPIEKLRALGDIGRERLAAHVGAPLAEQVATALRRVSFGAPAGEGAAFASRRAFDTELPPPIPADLRPLGREEVKVGKERAGTAAAPFSHDALRAGISARLNIDPKTIASLDPRRAIGPSVGASPTSSRVDGALDVPDITFRAAGRERRRCRGDDSFRGGIRCALECREHPQRHLLASPIAIAGRSCGGPWCAAATPRDPARRAHPLSNLPAPAAPYFDAATGYANRPNRPRPSGNPLDPPGDPNLTETPLTRTLQLYGCAEIPGASFYRLQYRYNGGAEVPFTGLSWNLYRMVSGSLQVHPVSADGAGWYPVIPSADNWHPHDMLLECRTAGATRPRPAGHAVRLRSPRRTR